MRRPSPAVRRLLLLFVASLVLSLSALTPSVKAEQVSVWTPVANYPQTLTSDGVENTGIASASCVSSAAYVYCIGGEGSDGNTNDTVYEALSALGIQSWENGSVYPLALNSQSCVVSSGYVYCVGGQDDFRIATSAAYYAPISDSGIGAWTPTTSLPVNASDPSCSTSNGLIYCIGGDLNTMDVRGTPEPAFYASLSSSGIGPWHGTTAYPGWVTGSSCFAESSTMYCVGGTTLDTNPNNATMYASLSSTGIGTWQSGSPYPFAVSNEACVALSGYAYCIGGQNDTSGGGGITITNASSSVYFAQIGPSGLGTWQSTASFPEPIFDLACVTYTYIYCFGGFEGNSDTLTDGVYSSGPPPTETMTATATSGLAPSTITITNTSTSQVVLSFTASASKSSSIGLGTGYLWFVAVNLLVTFCGAIFVFRRRRGPSGNASDEIQKSS